MELWFVRFSKWMAKVCGSPAATVIAVGITIAWLIWSWTRGFDTDSQIAYNTLTTASTGIMVFILLAAQNHQTAVIQAQLAELVRAEPAARNDLLALEDKPPQEIESIAKEIAQEAKAPPPEEPRGLIW